MGYDGEALNLWRKKQLIVVLEVLPNGDRRVHNKGNESDTWIIPKDVFDTTYEQVTLEGL